MDNQADLTLKLNTDEINLILEAVGQLPFVKVYALVAKIQQQAQLQLNGHANAEADLQKNALPS